MFITPLRSIFPCATTEQVFDCGTADTKSVGNLLQRLRPSHGPCAIAHCLRHDCRPSPPDVFGMRYRLEMVGVDTRSISTEVVYFHAIGDWAFDRFKIVTMRAVGLAIDRNRSVPVAIETTGEQPAPTHAINAVASTVFPAVVPTYESDVFVGNPPATGVVLTGTSGDLPTAAHTQTGRIRNFWGRLVAHLMVLSSGATPRTVAAVAGFSCASIIPENRAVMGLLGGSA